MPRHNDNPGSVRGINNSDNVLRYVYPTVDIFLNKRAEFLLVLEGEKPDVILRTEILPKDSSGCAIDRTLI